MIDKGKKGPLSRELKNSYQSQCYIFTANYPLLIITSTNIVKMKFR